MQNIKERQEFENYNKVKLLGEGSFGKAYLVERASDKLKCVMKQIDIGRMSEQEKRETVQEAKILEALSHPNIVKFIEVFKTKKGKLCIVMDFADGGDLQARVKEQRGRMFSESQILEWFTQICLGLKHIHDRKILHRDLKGQNIFLTKSGIVKIGDFGIAKVLATTMQNARTVVGTPYYLSPEIVQSKPYNFKSDIWSLGIVLYEMCAQKPPFDAPSLHFLAMKIVRGAYNPLPSTFSTELKNLVGSLINTNEKLRPDVNQILNKPIIQNRIKSFLTETVYHHEFSHTILHKQNVFDPKQQQIKQLQNLQQQINQQKPVIQAAGNQIQSKPVSTPFSNINQQRPAAQQQQAVPRYNPTPINNNAGNVRPQANVTAQQNPPSSRLPNRNQVSPGMAAAFGGGAAGAQKQQPTSQYGAVGYQPQNQKPNYHYQQQQQQQKPVVQQNPLGPDKKALDEQKAYAEKMKYIDQRLKEKEAELKKLDEIKMQRQKQEQQRKDYEKQLIDESKKRELALQAKQIKLKEEDAQKQRMQEEQARKIQESQQKRKQELEKIKKDELVKRAQQEEILRRKEQQLKEEKEKQAVRQKEIEEQKQKFANQQKIQLQQKAQQQQQQQKKEVQKGGSNDIDFIKQMAYDAQNKILDIEKKILAKDQYSKQQQPLMTNFDPPAAAQKQRVSNPPKSASRAPPTQQNQQHSKLVSEIKKVPPTQRQESESHVDRKRKEQQDQKNKEEAKRKFIENQQKDKGFIQFKGIQDSNDDQGVANIKNSKLEVKPKQEAPRTRANWNKNSSPMVEETKQQKSSHSPQPKRESRTTDNSQIDTSASGLDQDYSQQIQDEQVIQDHYEDYQQPQQDNQDHDQMNQEDKEIYQMYEEMLLLVRDGLDTPSKEEIDNPSKDEEEKKEANLSDSDEGFNDDRDEDFDKEAKNDMIKAQIIVDKKPKKSISPTKKNLNKRFDETLNTILEESEPENTFQNTHQQKGSNRADNVAVLDEEQDDRDDFDDDATDASSQQDDAQSAQVDVKNPFSHGINNNFTFAQGGNDDLLGQEISKFTSVEHLRDYLETELGEEKIMKAYPILKEFGDNIFFQEKTDELKELLKGILTDQDIKKYQAFFASLIFMELQAEKEGGGQEGIQIAMKTLKNINTTATFGRFF
eukprot:403350648